MANRLKPVGDGTASASAVQTGKSCIPSAEGLVSLEELTLRPWLLAQRCVPGSTATRAYFNACEYGKGLAALLLKRFAEKSDDDFNPPLGWFVLAMAGEMDSTEAKTLTPSQRGQIVGFCSALAPWLMFAVQRFGHNVSDKTEQSIADALNDALTCGPEKRWDVHMKEVSRENARKAANARWAKHREAQHA